MEQNIKNQCIFVHKFDVKIACLNLYEMIFHKQQECEYDFSSLSLATCASAVVSELILSKRVEDTCGTCG